MATKAVRKPGRPKGALNKANADIRAAAREYTGEALGALVKVLRSEDAQPSAVVAAANAILDRGFGKPSQPVEHSGEVDLRAWLTTLK